MYMTCTKLTHLRTRVVKIKFKYLRVILIFCLLALSTAMKAQTASVQLIHNSADPAIEFVDVYINGTLTVDSFTFRKATTFLNLPAGVVLNVGFAPPNSTSASDAIITKQVLLIAGLNYYLVVSGVFNTALFSASPSNQPIDFYLIPVGDVSTTTSSGNVKFAFFNLSTDAPSFDFYVNGVMENSNISYATYTGYVTKPAGNLVIKLTLAGTTTELGSYLAPFTPYSGQAFFIFSSGFINPANNQNGEPFALFACLPSGEVIFLPSICSNFNASVTTNQTTCGLPNGSLQAVAIGGATPFTYLWSNGGTSSGIQNLVAGNYSVTVTDNIGCTASSSAALSNSICPKINSQSVVSNVSQTGATISWSGLSCANKYRIILKNVSTSVQTTTTVSAPSTSINISGLQSNTTYQVRIRTQCSQNGSVVSQLSPITSFTTLNSQGIQCLPPSNVNISDITDVSAKLAWDPVTGAIQYNLRYRKTGTTTWINSVLSSATTSTLIQNLAPSTTYEYQLRTKCNNNPAEFSAYSSLFLFSTISLSAEHTCGTPEIHNTALTYSTMTDQDGNLYRTIVIGTQQWMAENLKTTRYRNGDVIPNVTQNLQWTALSTGAWAHYQNDSSNECPYGNLYNWYAVNDSRNLCPTGWHIPTDAEWTSLSTFLGGTTTAGYQMKTTTLWSSGGNGLNSNGFAAIPGGFRRENGPFEELFNEGYWWSKTGLSLTPSNAYYRRISADFQQLFRDNNSKRLGFSVRCVNDQAVSGRFEETNSTNNDVLIYPNPTNGLFNITITGAVEDEVYIKIVDLTGRVVLENIHVLNTGINSIFADLRSYTPGLYLIHINDGEGTRVYKLIKE